MAQIATTGNLEKAQKTIIATARYTEEHNAPAMALIESFSLPKGSKQVTVPKVGQMSMTDLQDGIDIVDHHPLTIIERRLGGDDQFSDLLSILLVYSNIDSFFISKFNNFGHSLTFFKINDYWSIIDPYYGVIFTNIDDFFASIGLFLLDVPKVHSNVC